MIETFEYVLMNCFMDMCYGEAEEQVAALKLGRFIACGFIEQGGRKAWQNIIRHAFNADSKNRVDPRCSITPEESAMAHKFIDRNDKLYDRDRTDDSDDE